MFMIQINVLVDNSSEVKICFLMRSRFRIRAKSVRFMSRGWCRLEVRLVVGVKFKVRV